jgi:hypothetical protein
LDTVRKSAGLGSRRGAKKNSAPYRDRVAHYADEARSKVAPHVETAVRRARDKAESSYHHHLEPRISHAREAVPPRLEHVVEVAADRTRQAAHRAAETAGPRITGTFNEVRGATGPKIHDALETARSHAEPVRYEARARGAAAAAVIRGQVSAADVEKLLKRQSRNAHRARTAKRLGLLALVLGAAAAGWQWWRQQSTPDWLVEEPPATEVAASRSTGSTATTGGKPAEDAFVHDTGSGSGKSVDSVDGSKAAAPQDEPDQDQPEHKKD